MEPLTPNLVALPPEIITQILLQVDWKGILQMRQTCRDLFKISQTRSIWTTLLNECSQTMAYPPRLVEPIDNYSTRELETLVLTKISSEVGWGSLHLPSERAATKGDPQCYGPRTLLEGGRWLLFHDHSLPDSFTGKISCCDLDSACLQVQPLLQVQTRIGDHRFSLQCIGSQVDKMATSGSFIVAFQLQSLGGDLRNYQIYQIQQQGRGSGAHFAVRSLSSFTYINRVTGPSTWAFTGLCLQGDYIMETPSRFCDTLLQVFNWRTSTSTIHEKSILSFDRLLVMATLLPENRVLCTLQPDIVSLYNLPEFKKYPAEYEMVGHSAEPILQVSVGLSTSALLDFTLSVPCLGETSTRLAMVTREGVIYGLTVPHDGRESNLECLGHSQVLASQSDLTLGIDKAYVESYFSESAVIVTFDWNTKKKPEIKSRTIDWPEHQRTYRRPALLDEVSGRVVRASINPRDFGMAPSDSTGTGDPVPWAVLDFCAPHLLLQGARNKNVEEKCSI